MNTYGGQNVNEYHESSKSWIVVKEENKFW